MTGEVLLLHSPLLGPSSLAPLAQLMRARGSVVVLPDLTAAVVGSSGSWSRFVEAACETGASMRSPVVLGHSGAGLVLPIVAARAHATASVFVDAVLPPCFGPAGPPPGLRSFVHKLVRTDGLLPPWTRWWGPDAMRDLVVDEALRASLEADVPCVPVSLYDEVVQMPGGWSDRRCVYLELSAAYADEADEARRRGWPVAELDAQHLAGATDPARVLDAIAALLGWV